MYGMVIANAGRDLLASLGTGETLTITRCMIGRGTVGSLEAAQALTDLVSPIAAATSTKPSHKDGNVSLMVEYRNDLDGGLQTDEEIREIGIWAQVGSQAEVLLLYGSLADRPQPVSHWTPGDPIEIRRFPITVGLSNDVTVILGYNALAFMTAEDVSQYCMEVVLPLFLEDVRRLIAEHNVSPTAHPDIRGLMDGLDSRLSRLELQYSTDVSGNPFEVTFVTLEGIICTGVWHKELARLEW